METKRHTLWRGTMLLGEQEEEEQQDEGELEEPEELAIAITSLQSSSLGLETFSWTSRSKVAWLTRLPRYLVLLVRMSVNGGGHKDG